MQQINKTITVVGGFSTTNGVIRIKYEDGIQVYDVQKKVTFTMAFYRNSANANLLVEDCVIMSSTTKQVYEMSVTLDIVPPINGVFRDICEQLMINKLITNPPAGLVLILADFVALPDPI